MSNLLILFTSMLLSIISPTKMTSEKTVQEKATTYYLIRHAEKDRSDAGNKNPDLNQEGKARARKWDEVLKDIDLDAIYSTDYNRTRQTVQPIAQNKNLKIKIYDPAKMFDAEFKKATSGKSVLVVGHSNTTPQFANAILKKPKYQDIDDAENGALFIVELQPDGSATCKVLYIN